MCRVPGNQFEPCQLLCVNSSNFISHKNEVVKGLQMNINENKLSK